MTDAITYLESSHKLRRNVLTGELLYADADGWRKLSKEGRNTIILNALRDGVSLEEETLDRFVGSTLVEQWNPARQWLDELPEWDGEDYVLELSQRVITSNPDWAERFHKWMLQTVARWMDMEVPHRDAIVPVIVGQWGYGKTSFCYQLLPPPLRLYYTDKIKLSNSAEVYELLTTNLLVNIDEFYQESTLQEPLVRYIFSRSTPVFRRPYGTTEEPRRKYAGFMRGAAQGHAGHGVRGDLKYRRKRRGTEIRLCQARRQSADERAGSVACVPHGACLTRPLRAGEKRHVPQASGRFPRGVFQHRE